MKLLHIFGSPHADGNTADISQAFCDEAGEFGATVTRYHLNDLDYRGCQGCHACKQGAEQCVLDDEITPALAAMQDADVILFSSPVYYADVSAQLKGFIDRTFGYFLPEYWKLEQKTRLKPGKKFVFLLVQGAVDEHRFADIFPRYKEIFNWHGFAEIHLLRAVGVYWPGQALQSPDIMQHARDLARQVFS